MKVFRTIPVLLVSFVSAVTLCAQQPTPPPPAMQKMDMSGKPGMMDEKMTEESMMAHHKEMMAMQPEMMKHMMAHMQMGMMKCMEESMAKCPMMKTMPPAKQGD